MANTKTTSQRKEARAADVLELATVKVQALQVGEMDCDFGLGLSDGFLSWDISRFLHVFFLKSISKKDVWVFWKTGVDFDFATVQNVLPLD